MHADMLAANDASICADYFFPKDKPGDSCITSMASVDTALQFLAGRVIDAKGASEEHAIKQIRRDLRTMGHSGPHRVKTDQESSIADVFRAVAK